MLYFILTLFVLFISIVTHNLFILFIYILYILYKFDIYRFIILKFIDYRKKILELKVGTYFKRIYGVCGVVGSYGQGKTIHMCKMFHDLKRRSKYHNPDNYIFISNFGLTDTIPFLTLQDVLDYYKIAVQENKGLIVFWDEIQNEFPESDRKFPLIFRVLLTQNRKNYGVRIIWSTQDYTRVNKNIRLMTDTITDMRCFFERLMIARVYKRRVYDDFYNSVSLNNKTKKKSVIFTVYAQTDKLRNAFNSFTMLSSAKDILGISNTDVSSN